MTLNRQQLLEKRGDLSPFLFHLTRRGNLKRAKELYSLEKDDYLSLDARKSLENIIHNRRIEARSAFGYFNFKVKYVRADGKLCNENSVVQRDWLKAVCFTETPIDHVYLQTRKIYGRSLNIQPYGLAFREEVIRRINGNPVFYLQTTNQSVRDTLDQMAEASNSVNFKAMMPFIEGFGKPWYPKLDGPAEVDFRWEREWRVVGDFSFSLSDIAFGLCPKADKKTLEALVNDSVPFVDPNDDMNAIKLELKKWNHLRDIK